MDLKAFKVSKNLITYLEPTSVSAEAYNTIRTNIHFSSVDKEVKTIVVTSPSVLDGKTVTACNLAVSFAYAGERVLLIDADLRRPSIHKQFKMANDRGLTDVLAKDLPVEKAIKSISDIENLSILTSGTIPPNPSVIISSKKLTECLEAFKGEYDRILIDTPPVGQVADGVILGGLCDGVLLVIAQGHTNKSIAVKAAKTLQNVNANVLGVVVTKAALKRAGYKEYYGPEE